MLAFAAFALGAAFALVVEAFFGAVFVAVFVSVFLGLPAVLVPAGLVALVVFYEGLAKISCESVGRIFTLAAGFFSLVEAAAGLAAGAFFANFTVPDGPVWLSVKNILTH